MSGFTAVGRSERTRRTWERDGFDTAEAAARELIMLLRKAGLSAEAEDDTTRRLVEGESVRFGGFVYFVR